MLTLLRLQPGVVQTGRGNGISIRGGRVGEEAVFVDGVLVHNFNRGGSALTIGTNTLAEVDVLTGGFSAQYGDAPSGIAAGRGVSNPVDLYLLQQAEARFGNGDLFFTADEQTRAFKAAVVFAQGPQDMFAPGRRMRLGIELSF